MSEYNIQMNKYNALNAEYDQLYPATKIENVDGLNTALQNNDPRNWGLGANAKLLTSADNLDNIKENGWYWWYDTRPSGAKYNYCHMRVDNGQTDTLSSVTQTIYRNSINSVMIRFYNGDTWITEYVNPPMELGVEYRTQERYLGKPVYRKLIWGGPLPNSGYTEASIASGCIIIQAVCHQTSAASASEVTPSTIGDVIPWNNNDNNGINMSAFKNHVNLWCKINRSSSNFVAYLWYIKDTD